MSETQKVLHQISTSKSKMVLEDLIIPGTRGIARVFAICALLFKGRIKISKVDKSISIR